MRHIFTFIVILFAISCISDPKDDPTKNVIECLDDPFHFSVDVAGISFMSDSC